MIKAIILDMYGVIVKQSGEDFTPFVQQTFPQLTRDKIYESWLKSDIGEISSLEVWKELGYTGDLEKIERDYLDTIELTDGLLDFLKNAKGKYKLAVISNDSSRWSHYLRDKFGLNQYFDVISVSGDLKMKKPDPRIFEYTLAQLGCDASDCIFVDDRENNLVAAEKVGLQTLLFEQQNKEELINENLTERMMVANYQEFTDLLANIKEGKICDHTKNEIAESINVLGTFCGKRDIEKLTSECLKQIYGTGRCVCPVWWKYYVWRRCLGRSNEEPNREEVYHSRWCRTYNRGTSTKSTYRISGYHNRRSFGGRSI